MKFACTTTADLAKQYGFDGIELTSVPAGVPADIEIACVASALEMPAGHRARAAAAIELRTLIDAAANLGCAGVRILGARLHAGRSAASVAVEMGTWLLPAADYASERGVTILVQNALSFRKSRDLWTLLDSIDHPNVAACWDLAAGLAAGESPFVAVPTLNTRIQHALVSGADETTEHFITRLRGIGYAGYVTVQSPIIDALPDVLVKLREWSRPQTAKVAPKAVKPASVATK